MIDIRKLKELVRLMVENELSELDLGDQQERVTIKRGFTGVPVVTHAPALPAAAPPRTDDDSTSGVGASDEGLTAVQSPMVGTFYSSPNPDAGAFVGVGSSVSADTVVCLVEAMKVFNEIKAECSGTIERVLVNSGDAVEFGQKLFLVRPA